MKKIIGVIAAAALAPALPAGPTGERAGRTTVHTGSMTSGALWRISPWAKAVTSSERPKGKAARSKVTWTRHVGPDRPPAPGGRVRRAPGPAPARVPSPRSSPPHPATGQSFSNGA